MFSEENKITITEQYQKYLPQFEAVKKELEDSLRSFAERFEVETKFNVIVLPPRLKGLGSLIGKIEKKVSKGEIIEPVTSLFKIGEDNTLTPVVNDFIGARVSCNTLTDVSEYAKILKEPSERYELIKEQDFNMAVKESGYRALHLDMFFKHYFREDYKEKLLKIPVEIQLKTHLQHAWGEITHDESYKAKDPQYSNPWEKAYSRHIADLLENLDQMALTIRKQRLEPVQPADFAGIEDTDLLISVETLSYVINQFKEGNVLNRQELSLVSERLRDIGFLNIAEVKQLLNDEIILNEMRRFKHILNLKDNISIFEILYYGALLKKSNNSIFQNEFRKYLNFTEYQCPDCNTFLTESEYEYMKNETDTDVDFYCKEHRNTHFPNTCKICRKLKTSQEICKNCEAVESPF